jgi:hypothetical protein
MTVGTAQAGGLFQCGVAIAAPHFFAKLLRRCTTGRPLRLAGRIFVPLGRKYATESGAAVVER